MTDFQVLADTLSLIPTIVKELADLKADRDFYRELAFVKVWMDRTETKAALNCCDHTLKDLGIPDAVNPTYVVGKIRHKKVRNKPFYLIEDIRKYLKNNKKIIPIEADRIVLKALVLKEN